MTIPANTTRLEPCPCPHCGTVLNAATAAEESGGSPSPGDVTLCVECGEWCLFDDELKLKKPSDDILVEIGSDPVLRQMRMSWLKMKARRAN